MKKYSVVFSAISILLLSVAVRAQFTGGYAGAWSSTWNNPVSASASIIIQGAINRKMLEQSIANQRGRTAGSAAAANISPSAAARPHAAADQASYAVLRFRPAANSGVAKQIADALGGDPKQRADLLAAFQAIKRSYESEAARGGKSNNIAAAMTFFLVATSMAYHQTDEPAESVTDSLVEALQRELSTSPDFKSMTDLQKQRMHDWLVISGGFVLAGYLDAVKTGDPKELRDYKDLANEFVRLVLGTGIEKFDLASAN